MKYILWGILTLSISANAKLLDKITAAINEKVVTNSEIKQIQKTIRARKEISPIIYDKSSLTKNEVIERIINSYIIRDKLSKLGYIVTDDSVENRIQMTENRLGLKRVDLMKYLKTEGLNFDEYFEIIRETIELNIFSARIIAPLVSITEQEIKNTFYRENSKNTALTFNYTLVDFYLPTSVVQKGDLKNLPLILKEYQLTGNIPELYKNVETTLLSDVAQENLEKKLSKILKNTDEGQFSKAISKNGFYHIFYVKKKDLKESEVFTKERGRIQNELFMKYAKRVSKTWFDKEQSNYYIKTNL